MSTSAANSYRTCQTDLSTSFQSARTSAYETGNYVVSSSCKEGYLSSKQMPGPTKSSQIQPKCQAETSDANIFAPENVDMVQKASSNVTDHSTWNNSQGQQRSRDYIVGGSQRHLKADIREESPTGQQLQFSVESDNEGFQNSNRKRSTSGSDIVVLRQARGSLVSAESDICVIQEPSKDLTSSSLGLNASGNPETFLACPAINPHIESPQNSPSPCGSLTARAVNSMVDSMYENQSRNSTPLEGEFLSPFKPTVEFTIGSVESWPRSPFRSAVDFTIGSVGSSSPGHTSPAAVMEVPPVEKAASKLEPEDTGIRFSCEDFSVIDHRLKLFLTMNVFNNTEEFSLVLKVHYVKLLTPSSNLLKAESCLSAWVLTGPILHHFTLSLICVVSFITQPSGIVQYPKMEEFRGLVVLSNARFYILKAKGKER